MTKQRLSIYNYKVIDNYLLIVDNLNTEGGDYLSVTNNIENVLSEINSQIDTDLSSLSIYYRDTLSMWDQVEITSMLGDKVEEIEFLNSPDVEDDYLEKLFFK